MIVELMKDEKEDLKLSQNSCETLSSPQRKGSSSETWSFLLSLLTDFRGNLSIYYEPQNLEVERMSSYLLTVLTKKQEVDTIIRDTIDKVLVLRFGRASDPVCLQLDDVLSKSAREVSKFASVALVDIDSNEIQVYVKYFDITFIPSTVFFFNAHHMKMDFGTADHTKWVGAFQKKQDFIDVVEAIYRGAMKGKLIVNCPLPPERIPKYQFVIQGCIKGLTAAPKQLTNPSESRALIWQIAKRE
nr:thioredoxin-like protein 4b [Quercus suber]